jgi:hypothetical protein
VPVISEALQHVTHAGLGADDGTRRNAEALRQSIGGLKANTVNVKRQAVRILPNFCNGVIAVGFVDAHCACCANAV